jgi:hypothetical protein
MKVSFAAQQLRDIEDMQLFLLTNGLGGYCSTTGAFSTPRCDQGVLVAAVKAPNVRINLVHRLAEQLILPETTADLASQRFADGLNAQETLLKDVEGVFAGTVPLKPMEAQTENSVSMEKETDI